MPAYGGAAVQFRAFLTSAMDGGDVQLHTLADVTYGERTELPILIQEEAGCALDSVSAF
jgi:hypothetical protein